MAEEQGEKHCKSNEAINPLKATHNYIMGLNSSGGSFAQSVTSGYGFVAGILKHGYANKAFADQFLVNKKRDYLKDDKGEHILDDNKKRIKGYDYSFKNIRKGKLIGGLLSGVAATTLAGKAVGGIFGDDDRRRY